MATSYAEGSRVGSTPRDPGVYTGPTPSGPTTATPGLDKKKTNWLLRDLLSQTEKNSVDIDLSSQLAALMRDRGDYQQEADRNLANTQRQGQSQFQQVAESYASRGLESSTPYVQADDQAFQGVQGQLGDIRSQLAAYLNNYDATSADARLQAEQQKRAIEAEALQRYAQTKLAQVGR